MGLFAKIVDGFQPLTIFTKSFFLDFDSVLDAPLSKFYIGRRITGSTEN